MNQEKRNVDVSAIVLTYNHEPYIEAALKSVLSQRGDFSFEVIVSEDCSTDGTRDDRGTVRSCSP